MGAEGGMGDGASLGASEEGAKEERNLSWLES